MNYLAVFIGGGLGSICRYGISRLVNPLDLVFPHATLVANALSCIVLGFFVFYFTKNEHHEAVKVMLLVGFCGGFSTFSTFANETILLVQEGSFMMGLANVFGNLALCIACLYLGAFLAR